MKTLLLAAALALTAVPVSANPNAAADPVAACRFKVEKHLIKLTAQRLENPSAFMLRSVGWFVIERTDEYAITVYYSITDGSERRGMTTATVLANSKQCAVSIPNFMVFPRR